MLYAKAGLALLAAQKGDKSAAEEFYHVLLAQRGTMLWTAISIDRLLGLLSQTMEKIAQALAHFEDALNFCREAGYKPELAWTCSDYAEVLLARDRAGDHIKATSLLEESLAISLDLGMRPLIARVAKLQENIETRAVSTSDYPARLSAREVEVLRLIAQGMTTRETATELTLSARTVQRHISNLYAKIDVRNRVEATAFAQNHPSITPQAPPLQPPIFS